MLPFRVYDSASSYGSLMINPCESFHSELQWNFCYHLNSYTFKYVSNKCMYYNNENIYCRKPQKICEKNEEIQNYINEKITS